MKKFPLSLGTGSSPGKDQQLGGTRHVNCYLEIKKGNDSKSQTVINAIAGLKRWDSGSYAGPARGLQKISDDVLYAILGKQVVKFTASGIDQLIGTLVGEGRVYAAQNMKNTTQIGLVTSDNQYFIIENDTITKVNDSDLPAPNSIAYLDGYFLLTIPNGQFFWTSVNEGAQVDALDFVTAESNADGLVVGIDYRGLYYVFGTETFEIWKNTGVKDNEFQPVQQDSNYGIMAGHALKKMKKGLIWPDHNGIVQFMSGAEPVEVSNSDVVDAISSLTSEQQSAMEADIEIVGDQEFYVLNSEKFTWVWSFKTKTWHERHSQGYDRSIRNVHEYFAGKHIIGSTLDGKLYEVDADTYTEDGLDILFKIVAPNLNAYPHSIRCSALHVDAVSGVGANSTQEKWAKLIHPARLAFKKA